jgi:hypothetical protein
MPFPSLFAVCIALACLAPAAAAAEDLAAVLARPISPGSVALLVEHAAQSAAQKRLIEAVGHQDPAVRAVAARVAFVTMSKGVAGALITAVAKEEHVHTGAEQVRALMALLGAPGEHLSVNAVKRLGAPAAIAMADSLARTRPDDLPRHLPMLTAAMSELDLTELGAAIATACTQHPTHAQDIIAAVLATKNEKLLTAVLTPQRFKAHRMPLAALMPALSSAEESQRLEILWHVFMLEWDGVAIPPDVLTATAPKPIAAGAAAADLTWEAFVREILARRRGAAATNADWTGLLTSPAQKKHIESFNHNAYGFLTDAEVKAIETVDGDDHEADKMRRNVHQKERDRQKAATPPSSQSLRTTPVFAKGLLGDLMSIHGCRPPRTSWFAAGDMKYRPDGRAQSLSIVQVALSQECQAFVRTAMMLSIASVDAPVVPERTDLVLVVFDPAFLACADDPFAASRPGGADVAVERHKMTKEPKAQYPDEFRRSGMPPLEVVLRVWVSHTGCASGAETLRGVLPAFDLEAIRSLFNAKFTPATLGGQPVDSTITFSMFFSLRR